MVDNCARYMVFLATDLCTPQYPLLELATADVVEQLDNKGRMAVSCFYSQTQASRQRYAAVRIFLLYYYAYCLEVTHFLDHSRGI